jgi:hypothetical protein
MALALANARGVPGTAALIATRARGERCIVTCNHVLFDGAREGDRVWALPPDDGRLLAEPCLLGRTADGALGRVGDSAHACFVDGALVELSPDATHPAWLRAELGALVRPVARTLPQCGARVTKDGATTGLTHGFLTSDRYATEPWLLGHAWTASEQLLVDSADDALVFNAPGDSGAALLDADGCVFGVLWGTTALGQGIAYPITRLIEHLGLSL